MNERKLFRALERMVTLGGRADTRVAQFLRYMVTSCSSFALDLGFLWMFTEVLHIYYLTSVALAFSIGVSFNYVTSRAYAFRGSTRGLVDGYFRFLVIALTGMAFILLAMHTLVETLHVEYLFARVIVGTFVGMWNYTMNAFWNFRR